MIKQIITIGAALALLTGCAPAKKSSLGAVVSRSPKIMTITEDQLESLQASEEAYFILFCAANDQTCKAIIDDTKKLDLNFESAYYFYDMKESTDSAATSEAAAQEFLKFMESNNITKLPAVQYRKGARTVRSYGIEDRDMSKVLTEEEEQARIAAFKTWMNELE